MSPAYDGLPTQLISHYDVNVKNVIKMPQFILFIILVLSQLIQIKCELVLKIVKNIDEVYTPVTTDTEEKAGTYFSLICELVSTDYDQALFDNQISWGKETADFRFESEAQLEGMAKKKSKQIYNFINSSEINKSVKYFSGARLEDQGWYFCMSLKYMLFKTVHLLVKNDDSIFRTAQQPFQVFRYVDNFFCNEKMFKCISNGACINHHYVCDGKPDCSDGSDENWTMCEGDPCRDKLKCDNGRCIPFSWCCDRHHDPNCTVMNRPSCCQLLSSSYDDDEYPYVEPYKVKHVKSNGTRYLFITICVLSTFLSILLFLLILSKIFMFAKKSASNFMFARTNQYRREGIPLRTIQSTVSNNYRCDLNTYQPNRMSEASNPLLNISEHPPAYSEVIKAGNFNEPPPPYSSRDCLNEPSRTGDGREHVLDLIANS